MLIIYTGGTIGMTQTEQGLAPAPGLQTRIEEALGEGLNDLPLFDLLELSPLIDSSNITPANWQAIYDTLQHHWSSYAGFVILHGTDTLAYSASVLSFMLGQCNKNVVITGSQIPLGMSRSDGATNIESALAIAAEPSFGMVSVLFHHTLMQGSRVTKFSSHDFKAFQSFNAEPLAKLSIHKQFNGTCFNNDAAYTPVVRDYEFRDGAVAVLPLYPSLPRYAYEGMLHSEQCQAVILQTYGAGNIADMNTDFVDFLAALQRQQKIVVNVTQCAHGGTAQGTYAAGSLLEKLGILDGKDMTLEAAYAKVHWLLAQGYDYDSITQQWAHAVIGEFTEA
nr:asparaginase [Marinomonas ostreistagni]